MSGWLSSRPFSNFSSDEWTSPASRYTSVEPHQTITRRSQPFSLRKRSMSAETWSARSRFDLPFLTFGPFSFFTYCGSKTAGHGLMPSRKSLIGSRSRASRTPHFFAASYALSG